MRKSALILQKRQDYGFVQSCLRILLAFVALAPRGKRNSVCHLMKRTSFLGLAVNRWLIALFFRLLMTFLISGFELRKLVRSLIHILIRRFRRFSLCFKQSLFLLRRQFMSDFLAGLLLQSLLLIMVKTLLRQFRVR